MPSLYAARATDYARDVVEGRVLACRYVRQACQRHLDDLADPDSPYVFDADAVHRVCLFVELMPHVKGKWARGSDTLTLEPWQIFMVGAAFGWLRKSDGLRRYRRAYVEVPRKNAKSTISAALGLYMLAMDREPGAEVYSGATTEYQAWEVFRPAKQMAERVERFRERAGVKVNAKTIVAPTGSRFAPLIGNPGDGASPHFAITDEYHEHKTEEQYDTMLTGMGAREHPMSWVITTAGSDTSGPCYQLRLESGRVLAGEVDNPELFALIYTIDDGVEWTSDEALEMANPNLGVSVDREFLQRQQRDAINEPRKQSSFKTKHLNLWVGAASPFFNLEKWNRLGDASLTPERFRGRPCWVAADLAAKIDITAVVKLYREGDEYFVIPTFYVPEEIANDPGRRDYAGWVAGGHMVATPGNVTDFAYVEADLVAAASEHQVRHYGFDQWNSMHLSGRVSEATGVECVDIPMTVKHLSDPMKWVQALIEDGRLHHDGNPVMAWMIGNVTASEDRNGNVFPRKERPENKIDGAVALIMAMERGFQQAQPSSYLAHPDYDEVFGED